MDERRNFPHRCRKKRRHGRIAAEADHGGGPHAAKHAVGFDQSNAEHGAGARQRDRIAAAHGLARNDMHLSRRKLAAVAAAARVGRKVDGDATARERPRQRLGWKQMPAGSTSRQQHYRRIGHQAALPASAASRDRISVCGRSRVKASNIPMPQASEIIEDPPYEMNGSVMPLAGMRCIFTAMLMADCRPNNIAIPAAAKRRNGSSMRMACMSARSTMNANSTTSTRQSTMPNSSAATAKTKSAWLSGSTRFTVPSPGPRPNQPPRRNDSSA